MNNECLSKYGAVICWTFALIVCIPMDIIQNHKISLIELIIGIVVGVYWSLALKDYIKSKHKK